MQIEHAPWKPTVSGGIDGQKIAIVGYSHYADGPDQVGLTQDVVQSVVDGNKSLRFFCDIQSYFGCEDDAEFWNRVLFFNFLPDVVGLKPQKYDKGTPEQLERGRDRFLRIIGAEMPDKVFVFTRKGWGAFPETTVEEQSGNVCTPLISNLSEPNWGTYMAGSHPVLVCGLRHPQFARSDDMRQQVRAFLELRP